MPDESGGLVQIDRFSYVMHFDYKCKTCFVYLLFSQLHTSRMLGDTVYLVQGRYGTVSRHLTVDLSFFFSSETQI